MKKKYLILSVCLIIFEITHRFILKDINSVIYLEFFIFGILFKIIFDDFLEYSINEEKKEYEIILDDEEKEQSSYCKICSACGEEGCCSPLLCQQHKDGAYCDWYLRDLKYGYKSYNDILKYIDDNFPKDSKIYKDIDNILENNLNKFYNKDDN